MYKMEVARVKLSNLISKSKFINTNQMSIHLFPVMHLYALHHDLRMELCAFGSIFFILYYGDINEYKR